jgi:iron complex transport system permease protein
VNSDTVDTSEGEPVGPDTASDRSGRRFVEFDASLVSVCLGSVLVVLAGALIQVRYGTYSMTFSQALGAVFNQDVLFRRAAWDAFLFGGEFPDDVGVASTIVWNLRLPRVLVAVFVGMNLAVSGAILQAVTRNELASPFVLGVSSGAGLLILLTLVTFTGLSMFLPFIASIGGAAAFLLVYAIAWKNGTSPVRLVLAGVIVGTVFSSLQTAMFFFASDIGIVRSAIAWTTGSLTGTDWEQVRIVVLPTVIAVGLSLVSARQLNVLLLGERTASSLGMSVERVRFAVSGIAVLAASASIAVAGIVGFVGLIVPHVVRNLVGSDYRKLIVGCLFVGPALMVAADVGARLGLQFAADVGTSLGLQALAGTGGQMPVGIVTGLIGGPYFLYLMQRQEQLGDL